MTTPHDQHATRRPFGPRRLTRFGARATQRALVALGAAMAAILLASFLQVVRAHVQRAAHAQEQARSQAAPGPSQSAGEGTRSAGARTRQAYAK